MLRKFAVFCCCIAVSLSVFTFSGCEETKDDLSISQFDRPQDVALVCYDDNENIPLPLNCCKTELTSAELSCASRASSAVLYAFVTQTTSGEVAVVNVKNQKIIDQESSIPYNTFIPVGGQPNDIAASDDGFRVYTANYETGDLSVIKVVDKETNSSVIKDTKLIPSSSIDLGGPADKLVLVKSPEKYRDRFALVTQPTLGRLSVVALDADSDCPDSNNNPNGCLLGYVVLPAAADTDESEPELSHPSAITSAVTQSVFVGSRDNSILWDVQIESLISEALNLESVGPVDAGKVLNDIIDIAPYTARVLSMEPVGRRWIYGIDGVTGGVFYVNLKERVPANFTQGEVGKINISGKARSLKLVELEESGDPDPLTFNGTFAIVATTLGNFGVVDIEDNQPTTTYYKQHMLRSVVDLSDPDAGVPQMEEEPTLTVNSKKVEGKNVKKYLTFVEDEIDGGCETEDPHAFKAEYDNGVRFKCDPYQSRREKWSMEWSGSIGVAGLGIITNIAKNPEGPWELLHEDENKNFCSLEVYTPESESESIPGYAGDILVITSDPTPEEGQKDRCKKIYDKEKVKLEYRIIGVSQYKGTPAPNVIKFEKLSSDTPDLLDECFGQAINFDIRADEQWIVKGTRSSYARSKGDFNEEKAICKYNSAVPSKMRMFPGQTYENDYIKFKMEYQDQWIDGPAPIDKKTDDADTDMEVDATIEFSVINGYEEMYKNISASNITDIELTPDNEILLVDQAGQGLVVFDLLNNFSTIGGNIN